MIHVTQAVSSDFKNIAYMEVVACVHSRVVCNLCMHAEVMVDDEMQRYWNTVFMGHGYYGPGPASTHHSCYLFQSMHREEKEAEYNSLQSKRNSILVFP